MKVKILYIWDADYPWDVRVDKICKTLDQNEYEVHIAARNLKKAISYEYSEGLHIHRIAPYKNDKINYLFSFPLFFNPVWKRFLDNIINSVGIQLIIVRDLPMAIAGIKAGERHKIPVIFDMAEDYIAMLKDIWKFRKFEGLNFIVRNPFLAKFVEKYAFKHSDHILTVIEEAKDIVVQRGGDPSKISIVGNTPDPKFFKNYIKISNKNINQIKEHYSAIYIGGLQRGRGLQTVLGALPDLIKSISNFLFVIVGDGYMKQELIETIDKNNLHNHVLFVGWVDHNELPEYINASKVGLIPHFVTEHKNNTIPNKLFDYMGFGLPVVASTAAPIKRILISQNCGLCHNSGDSIDFAKCIKQLYNSETNYGQNGREAVQNIYNWDKDSVRLLNVIQSTIKTQTKV